jgi:2'-5' RNA ligase
MRTFISFPVKERVKNKLKTQQEKFKKYNQEQKIKWTKKAKMHVTVKFIGEVEQEDTGKLAKILEKSAENIQPFEYNFYKLDAFPSKKNPSTIINKIKEQGREGFELEQNLRAYLKKYNFSFDSKKWIPHITLGRVKKESADIDFPSFNINYNWQVNKVELIESELTESGPKYSTISKVEL